MAAVIHPSRRFRACEGSPPRPQPSLRLIEGGRSPSALAATYRRRRLAAGVLVVLVVLALFVGILAVRSLAPSLAPSPPVGAGATDVASGPVHVVQPGDTLWSIAQDLDEGGDVRAIVDRLAAAHGGGPLVPGDRIALGR